MNSLLKEYTYTCVSIYVHTDIDIFANSTSISSELTDTLNFWGRNYAPKL